ncbi:MAG: zinc-dependent alcohol dehydrogenase family protein [Candidatus Aenigmarchaeota archaeon]|nr:zinc-dependent alcohol dehydrogenase family protein [Candidatus Aenigmarchaeota archaeon]
MKAMVLESCADIDESPLRLKDVQIPEPGNKEVRIRVSACGVCRTDLHTIEGDIGYPDLPLIPGHQIIGKIDKLGKNAKRFKIGDRIGIAWLRHTCGNCVLCKDGKENLCENSLFTGYHKNGGYAEYAIVPEDFAYEIPKIFTDEEATPLLCGGIIGYRCLKRAGVKPGQSLLLNGFGSSAHIVIQIAKYWGCKVYVVSRNLNHQNLARKFGAFWVGGSTSGVPENVDAAIIFAPAGNLVPQVLEKLKKGGTVALGGIYMSDIPEMNYEKHLFYEKNIHSVTSNTRKDGEELLKIVAKIPIRPQTNTYPLEKANEALQDLKHDKIEGTAVLVPV